jgi:hypothetical protein
LSMSYCISMVYSLLLLRSNLLHSSRLALVRIYKESLIWPTLESLMLQYFCGDNSLSINSLGVNHICPSPLPRGGNPCIIIVLFWASLTQLEIQRSDFIVIFQFCNYTDVGGSCGHGLIRRRVISIWQVIVTLIFS